MSLDPLPANAQLHYEPADHSYVTVDGTVPFYAQATLPVNQFAIPPYDEISLTNNTDGNPTVALYKKQNVVVATMNFTYDGNGYLTNVTLTYPS